MPHLGCRCADFGVTVSGFPIFELEKCLGGGQLVSEVADSGHSWVRLTTASWPAYDARSEQQEKPESWLLLLLKGFDRDAYQLAGLEQRPDTHSY